MFLKLFQPQSRELRKYIECFYIYTRDPDEEPTKYLTFPTIFTLISLSRSSATTKTENGLVTKYCPASLIETNLVCSFNKPVCIEYIGQINEITIYFKPLGINAFLENDLSFYNVGEYADFAPYKDFKPRMLAILSEPSVEKRLFELEKYWLSKRKEFRQPLLDRVIDDILESDLSLMTITALSQRHGVSRSTLNKYFATHICKTPSEFRKIARFRQAMNRRLQMRQKERLTDITYALDYFDQSHMVKDFRSLTGYSPGKFFSNISELENGQISWLFL